MPIDNITGKTAGNTIADTGGTVTAPKKASSASALNPDDFIKLFLAQLKHQDPMKPTDSSAILQQMSQISQISSSSDMQKTMRELSNSVNVTLANSQVLEATQLIGKHVQLESSAIPLTKEEGLSGSVMVPSAANDVTVSIVDATGNILKTLDLGQARSSGLMDFKWDGLDKDGNKMPPDFYHITASAMIEGKATPSRTAGSFKVNSVALDSSGVIMNVDGLGGKNMGEIIKIL